MMILSLAFPNLVGLVLMSREVKNDMKSYFHRRKRGEISPLK
jgi:alanine or glycine:cation symporter, AGCS family